MRLGAFGFCCFVSACSLGLEPAPIEYKTFDLSGQKFDGVPLAILCELASRVGTDYLAEDVKPDDATKLRDQRVQYDFLNVEGATCAEAGAPIALAFVADPDRRLVSTWGGMQDDGFEDQWGSCLADTARTPGDSVLFCELGTGVQSSLDNSASYTLPAGGRN